MDLKGQLHKPWKFVEQTDMYLDNLKTYVYEWITE